MNRTEIRKTAQEMKLNDKQIDIALQAKVETILGLRRIEKNTRGKTLIENK